MISNFKPIKSLKLFKHKDLNRNKLKEAKQIEGYKYEIQSNKIVDKE